MMRHRIAVEYPVEAVIRAEPPNTSRPAGSDFDVHIGRSRPQSTCLNGGRPSIIGIIQNICVYIWFSAIIQLRSCHASWRSHPPQPRDLVQAPQRWLRSCVRDVAPYRPDRAKRSPGSRGRTGSRSGTCCSASRCQLANCAFATLDLRNGVPERLVSDKVARARVAVRLEIHWQLIDDTRFVGAVP